MTRCAWLRSFTIAALMNIALAGAAHAQPEKFGFVEIEVLQVKQEELKAPPAKLAEGPVAPPAGTVGTAVFQENVFTPEPERRDGGLTIGVGFYFVRPFWESNLAFTANTSSVVGGITSQTFQSRDFDYGTDLAPRLFLSYVGECCGLGARIAWWHYDQRTQLGFTNNFVANQFTNVNGPGNTPGTQSNYSPDGFGALTAGQSDVLTFKNRLVVDVWDFDVSQRFVANDCWNLTGGAGIRYNHIAQYYEGVGNRTGLPAGGISSREVYIRNFLNMAGPNLFLEGKGNLGSSGLAIYGNARGGFLFGTGQYTQTAISTFSPALGVRREDQIDRNTSGLPFAEAEIGLEWQARNTSRIQPFLRLGVVGQNWWGVGSALTSAALRIRSATSASSAAPSSAGSLSRIARKPWSVRETHRFVATIAETVRFTHPTRRPPHGFAAISHRTVSRRPQAASASNRRHDARASDGAADCRQMEHARSRRPPG